MEKNLKKIKYPKFIALILTFILAYALFGSEFFQPAREFLISLGYLGTFFAGMFFVYGFTAAPATAVLFILANQQNIFLAGLIAGFGSLVGDLVIFKIIRHSFADEIREFSREKTIQEMGKNIPKSLKKYLVPIIAGFVIASPLPDEIGIALFAASKNISIRNFAIISYALNTVGIFAILLIGKSV